MEQAVDRSQMSNHLAQVLNITQVRDYCPNGLQVEGRERIARIVTGVTASLAMIEAAVEAGADALLVHHGYFWRNEDPCIVGQKGRRIRKLIQHDINLFAYHLPLDLHPEMGNNAQLAQRLGLVAHGRFGDQQLGWIGNAADAGVKTVGDLARVIETRLHRAPLVIGDMSMPLGQIGWCTGAAQGFLPDAVAAGASVYISGEISEPTVHAAREAGVAYIAAGHHATERYGIQAIGDHLAAQFGLTHDFIDIDNPV
jgi:dinuclear metal center YbgI/SA1388 family protein